ncbi:Uridine diphosphate glucose pyrophosphatase [Paragonimus skrjabini miyazakii]|uniref:Uridine diphosphate glucose pyrophosphatase NUDT14 n=1 Tax=Paragonimus skrjabini miyazakii TaxID=59628 RepID=A0A8S9YLV6_9TREM|nr:Uridine diphosphate glucose pyrophosphatase [Paragonimus skrjabini miyazakii]
MAFEISDFRVKPLVEPSKYVKLYRLHFLQNGKPRTWDGILSHNSVSVLIYHTEKKCILLVKQFRPVVYYLKLRELSGKTGLDEEDEDFISLSASVPASKGDTIELCAGLIDGEDPRPEKTAVQEVLEECGYKVSESSLRLIQVFASSVGLIGNQMTCYYTEVDETLRVPGAGGGLREEGEYIQIIEWPVTKLDDLIEPRTDRPGLSASLLYALSWFKTTILPSMK